jgi:hypothetical protein
MEKQAVDYRTTVQMLSDWRERKVLERSQTFGEQFLSYLLPALWVLAVVVGGAVTSW